jgi:hypothetical protein
MPRHIWQGISGHIGRAPLAGEAIRNNSKLLHYNQSEQAFICQTDITGIGHNEVVDELDVEQFCGMLHLAG